MPKKKQETVHAIFEKFVFTLGTIIKEKVAESVQAATNDFFAGHFGKPVQEKEEKKPIKKRAKRGRKKGSKNKAIKSTQIEKPAQE